MPEPTAAGSPRNAPHRLFDGLQQGLTGETGGGDLRQPVGVIADFLPDDAVPELAARAARDALPLPDDESREGYFQGYHMRYWTSGLEEYDKVVAGRRRHGITGGRVFDFGGSTGRVFRHFYCQDRKFDVWSSDFNINSFRWNQHHMPRDIRVLLNTATPALPLPDRSFDTIMAFSVFTHIDHMEIPWLLELRRVLRPGGLLYLTFHDEAFWEHKRRTMLEALQRSAGGELMTADSPFPGPRSAFYWTDDSVYACNVFHSCDYVTNQWGRYFDILEFRPLESDLQCVALLTYSD